VPEEWTKVYDQWLENIQDWCISRQLWWGPPDPAWYAPMAPRSSAERTRRRRRARAPAGKAIAPEARDPDVLDTWFSSAFVPFSTLGWPDEATFERERASTCPRR
jgi:valyl-tRNA synthetase